MEDCGHPFPQTVNLPCLPDLLAELSAGNVWPITNLMESTGE